MAKKIEITEAQLEAIRRMADTLSAMRGVSDGDFDKHAIHDIRLVDRMLKKNNLPPRRFN